MPPKKQKQHKVKSESPEDEFEVEAIRGHEIIFDDNDKISDTIFFIKWKNYDYNENSWEPRENLNCRDILGAYLEAQGIKAYRKGTRRANVLVDRIRVELPESPSCSPIPEEVHPPVQLEGVGLPTESASENLDASQDTEMQDAGALATSEILENEMQVDHIDQPSRSPSVEYVSDEGDDLDLYEDLPQGQGTAIEAVLDHEVTFDDNGRVQYTAYLTRSKDSEAETWLKSDDPQLAGSQHLLDYQNIQRSRGVSFYGIGTPIEQAINRKSIPSPPPEPPIIKQEPRDEAMLDQSPILDHPIQLDEAGVDIAFPGFPADPVQPATDPQAEREAASARSRFSMEQQKDRDLIYALLRIKADLDLQQRAMALFIQNVQRPVFDWAQPLDINELLNNRMNATVSMRERCIAHLLGEYKIDNYFEMRSFTIKERNQLKKLAKTPAVFLYVLFMGIPARQVCLKNMPTDEQIADAERQVRAKDEGERAGRVANTAAKLAKDAKGKKENKERKRKEAKLSPEAQEALKDERTAAREAKKQAEAPKKPRRAMKKD